MLTIHHLEVQFDVASGGDEEVFARLFERHISAWQRLAGEAERRRKLSDRDRCLHDREQEGEPW